jgi:hypothetical protein
MNMWPPARMTRRTPETRRKYQTRRSAPGIETPIPPAFAARSVETAIAAAASFAHRLLAPLAGIVRGAVWAGNGRGLRRP